MKFDKEMLIGIIICAVILFSWDPLCRAMGWSSQPDNSDKNIRKSEEKVVSHQSSIEKNSGVAVSEIKTQTPAAVVTVDEPAPLPRVELQNDVLAFIIDQNSGDVKEIILKNYRNNARNGNVTLDSRLRNSGLKNGAFAVFSANGNWKTTQAFSSKSSDNSLKLTRRIVSAAFPD